VLHGERLSLPARYLPFATPLPPFLWEPLSPQSCPTRRLASRSAASPTSIPVTFDRSFLRHHRSPNCSLFERMPSLFLVMWLLPAACLARVLISKMRPRCSNPECRKRPATGNRWQCTYVSSGSAVLAGRHSTNFAVHATKQRRMLPPSRNPKPAPIRLTTYRVAANHPSEEVERSRQPVLLCSPPPPWVWHSVGGGFKWLQRGVVRLPTLQQTKTYFYKNKFAQN